MRIPIRLSLLCPAIAALVTVAMLAGPVSAQAATEPTKFVPSLRFGANVDKATGENVCLVSGVSCGGGEESEGPGGFTYPESVAVAKNGNVYVADNVDHRIQEFTANGEFVLMFGWNVNKTKVKEAGASQAARNVCTAAEVKAGAECLSGEEGTGEGTENAGEMLKGTKDVAVDQSTGDVYVLDQGYRRVDEFTENGEFILMIGGDVNKTNVAKAGASEAEKNLCTAASNDVCEPGTSGTGHGVVEGEAGFGDLLAVGGPEGLLYFGDGARVQEFDTENGVQDGEWAGEISLSGLSPAGSATAIAVDSSGDVFVADSEAFGVHEYNAKGELQPVVIDPEGQKEGQFIKGLALDFYGRLALTEQRPNGLTLAPAVGLLYKTSGELIGEFTPPLGTAPGDPDGLAFDASSESDQLYVTVERAQAVEVYVPAVFPEVKTCAATAVLATTVTLCEGINPNGILAKGFFDYGPAGEAQTATPVAFEGEGTAFESHEVQLTGLVPNQTYQFKGVVEALAEGAEKQATGEVQEFHTATPPPVIPGVPAASFVKAQSAVLTASLNPEHASTRYDFQYGACPSLAECAGDGVPVQATGEETSSRYPLIGVTQEARGLQPDTVYHYRLIANNRLEVGGKPEGGEATGAEGSFTTGPAPIPAAVTGAASAIGATSAIVSGSVDPDGQPATYAFELGVYNGAATRYGVVFSGPAGAGTASVSEALGLSGLQPGTTYAYRVKVASGYGTATGAAVLFTTAGLPEVLVSPVPLVQLAVPSISFPVEAKAPAVKAPPKKKARKQTKKRAKKGAKKKSRGAGGKAKRARKSIKSIEKRPK